MSSAQSRTRPNPGMVQGSWCAKTVSRGKMQYTEILNAAHLKWVTSFCCFLTFYLWGWKDFTTDFSLGILTTISLELQELLPGDWAPAAPQGHNAQQNMETSPTPLAVWTGKEDQDSRHSTGFRPHSDLWGLWLMLKALASLGWLLTHSLSWMPPLWMLLFYTF